MRYQEGRRWMARHLRLCVIDHRTSWPLSSVAFAKGLCAAPQS